MRAAIQRLTQSQGLMARAMRSSAIHSMGFVAGQALRLGSNLILTRILFPEAFGLMALVSVVMMGLSMFSDAGVSPAIMQSKRGDERAFLDTAWTIQVVRGFGLWLAACALAYPFSVFYEEPILLQILPIYGITLVITGANPTKLETANRHLKAGKVTVIALLSQTIGLIAAIGASWLTGSIWALVFSGIVTVIANLILLHAMLPGPANKFHWETPAALELIHFGKWIFLSTICGFISIHGDKLIIGKYLSLRDFGIYNIGYFLASVPILLGGTVTQKVLIPIYRENPPAASRENFLRLRKMRFFATTALLFASIALSLMGVWLVEVMYDDRYLAAGGVVVVLALTQIPQILAMTYDQAALAAGNSRHFFVLSLVRAVCIVGALLAGLETMGLLGALIGVGVAHLLAYPVVIWLARAQGAWDAWHDLAFWALALTMAAIPYFLHQTAIFALIP